MIRCGLLFRRSLPGGRDRIGLVGLRGCVANVSPVWRGVRWSFCLLVLSAGSSHRMPFLFPPASMALWCGRFPVSVLVVPFSIKSIGRSALGGREAALCCWVSVRRAAVVSIEDVAMMMVWTSDSWSLNMSVAWGRRCELAVSAAAVRGSCSVRVVAVGRILLAWLPVGVGM